MISVEGITTGDIPTSSELLGKFDLNCPSMGKGLNYWQKQCTNIRRPAGCRCPGEVKTKKTGYVPPPRLKCPCGSDAMSSKWLKKAGRLNDPTCSECLQKSKKSERNKKARAALKKRMEIERLEHQLKKLKGT